MFRRHLVTVFVVTVVIGLAACSGASKPTRDAFAEHSLVIVANAKTDADKERTRTVFGCLYDHLDDSTIEDLMNVAEGEKISNDVKNKINAPLGECYKTLAGIATTTTP